MNVIQKNIFKGFLYCSLLTSISIPAFALPAKPGPIQVFQPDGSEITIYLEGDEKSHIMSSEDGYILTTDEDGFYVFAKNGEDGSPVSSGIRVSNLTGRTPEIRKAIESLNQEGLRERIINRNSKPSKIATRGPGLFSQTFPTSGEQKGLVILVDFPDKPFTLENPYDYFYGMLNEEGFSDYYSTGSARDYYIQNSSGAYMPEFDVFGPFTVSQNYAFYGKNNAWGDDRKVGELIVEACELADETVDFSQYDRNEDGFIDNVYVFYAGFGEADGGEPDTIWPHSWDISEAIPNKTYDFDGKRLNHYACSNEMQYSKSYTQEGHVNLPDGIGSFVHEFSHVMGLPDHYSTAPSGAFTPGSWDIMDVGSYNGNSRTPPNFSSVERYAFDWLTPEEITGPGEFTLEPLHESNKAYIVTTSNPNEYFLLENRRNEGFDEYIPYHGMLIWHVDFVQSVWDENSVNNKATHQHVDIIEADNTQNASSRSGDPFPGKSKVTSFTFGGIPSFQAWDGSALAVDIYDIKESINGIISFTTVASGEENEESGINTIVSSNGVSIRGNMVSLKSGEGIIYDLTGRKVTSVGQSPVTLPSGIYFLRHGEGSHKFIIK